MPCCASAYAVLRPRPGIYKCAPPPNLPCCSGSADADEGGDLYNSNKGVQEALFSTLFTLTKNRALDTSQRLAALRIIIEFLQLMRVIFNSMAWSINRNLWCGEGKMRVMSLLPRRLVMEQLWN